MDIGGDLRRARTARKLSLADIARRTKISPSVLRAIETNRFDCVPGGLFTRSFLRTYAREVELDPDAIVRQYRAEFEAPPVAPDGAAARVSPVDVHVDATPIDGESRGAGQTVGLAVVMLIGLAYFGFFRDVATQSTATGLKPADAVEASAAALPSPVGTTGSADTARDVPNGAPLKFEIQASGPCWVAASADGERLIARLMNAGEKQQFGVRDEVTMRVGDPSAFTFTINGAPGRSLGPAGIPVNAQMTRQNYKTFLQAR